MSIGANGLFSSVNTAVTATGAEVWKPVNKAAATGGSGGLSALDKAFLPKGAEDSVSMSSLGKALSGAAAKLFEQLDGDTRSALEEMVRSGRMSAEDVVKGLRGLAKRAVLGRYEEEAPRTESEIQQGNALRERRAALQEGDPEYEKALKELNDKGKASYDALQRAIAGLEKGEWGEIGAQYDAAHLADKEEKIKNINKSHAETMENLGGLSRRFEEGVEKRRAIYNDLYEDSPEGESSRVMVSDEYLEKRRSYFAERDNEFVNLHKQMLDKVNSDYDDEKKRYIIDRMTSDHVGLATEYREKREKLYEDREEKMKEAAKDIFASERSLYTAMMNRKRGEAQNLNLFAGEDDTDILSAGDSKAADALMTLDVMKKGYAKAGRTYAAGVDLNGGDALAAMAVPAAAGRTAATGSPPAGSAPVTASSVPGNAASQAFLTNGTSALSLLNGAASTAAIPAVGGSTVKAAGTVDAPETPNALLQALKGKGSIIV